MRSWAYPEWKNNIEIRLVRCSSNTVSSCVCLCFDAFNSGAKYKVSRMLGTFRAFSLFQSVSHFQHMLLWCRNKTALLLSSCVPRFGWFGIEAEKVTKPTLNYCGAGLCLLRYHTNVHVFVFMWCLLLCLPYLWRPHSAIVFFFVKSDVQRPATSEETPLLIDSVCLLFVCVSGSVRCWIG